MSEEISVFIVEDKKLTDKMIDSLGEGKVTFVQLIDKKNRQIVVDRLKDL